ncbi:MAG: LPS export ABC transporter periplasmic protein LptC [Flavobacteriales bacterium]|nr:LPS export ABC transporter periplasmic protein LptC [Flavobacteriales bacterium]MCB9449163.1 LPS export ABC transporter periplasmic protein LptC [Flavobacteriales bacterium]
MEKVNLITQAEEQAQEVSKDIDILYSDSAAIKVHLTAPVMNHFAGDNPRLEFPAGLHVEFFDSIGEPSANLSSRYAVRNINEKKMEARNDVVVVNTKGEKLNTEYLEWDEEEGMIHTNEKVRLTTATEVIWGEGLDADQYFRHFQVRNIQGSILLDDLDTDSTQTTP